MAFGRKKRTVPVGRGLYFDYEAPGILEKLATRLKCIIDNMKSSVSGLLESVENRLSPALPEDQRLMQFAGVPQVSEPNNGEVLTLGHYVPFRQAQLKGQINPLRAPINVEPVLI